MTKLFLTIIKLFLIITCPSNGVLSKTFLPVKSSNMPPAQISGWEKCDKAQNPTAPACSCPCNSELVTVTQYYPGHLKCIDQSLKSMAPPPPLLSSTNTVGETKFSCPRNFMSVGSSSITCSENVLSSFIPTASELISAAEAASNSADDPFMLLRCNCFSKCVATADCYHVVFVSGNSPKCELYGETCSIATNPHSSGLNAQLYQLLSKTLESSDSTCKQLGWALTDKNIPQRICSSAGVCDKKIHGHLLEGGRCRRRCSGDLALPAAKEFCKVLDARLCEVGEILTMDLSNKNSRACGGDFHVLDDVPGWTSDKCISNDYKLLNRAVRCQPNTASTTPGVSNEIPLGKFSNLFDCVQDCANKHTSSGLFQGCRYIGFDGESCWMINTASVTTCLSGISSADYIFDASPKHHLISTYEVFSDGQTVIQLVRYHFLYSYSY
jgi:hypothetical protein